MPRGRKPCVCDCKCTRDPVQTTGTPALSEERAIRKTVGFAGFKITTEETVRRFQALPSNRLSEHIRGILISAIGSGLLFAIIQGAKALLS